jgi:hypothetical protein
VIDTVYSSPYPFDKLYAAQAAARGIVEAFSNSPAEILEIYAARAATRVMVKTFPNSPDQIPVRKRDYMLLDDVPPWTGVPPFRVLFEINLSDNEDDDHDSFSSRIPYENENKVTNYLMIDKEGYEIDVANRKRTGYRFYCPGEWCYLATESKPRKKKYEVLRADKQYSIPESVDTRSYPWINITYQNTTDIEVEMPGTLVESLGTMPVKPLIYSDYPLTDKGRVSEGHAMCMADCPDGMLMKLLHKGQSIWGKSGKP